MLTKKRILLSFLVISLIMLFSAVYWFAMQNKWLIAEYHKQNEMSAEQDKFEALFLSIQSAESAVRGFAGSGDARFIAGFSSFIDSIRSNYRQLQRFQDVNRSAIDPLLFSKLDKLVKEKIDYMLQVKKLCEKNHFDTARSLIATSKGLLLTDSILAIHHAANASFIGTIKKNIQSRKQ